MSPNIKVPEGNKFAQATSRASGEDMAGVAADVLRKRCAGIQRQKGRASAEELLPIADQAATYVDGPHIDHSDLLYDENGLPASSERPLNPTTVLSEVQQLGLETPSEATGIVRTDRDSR